jgi:hypothetical protein
MTKDEALKMAIKELSQIALGDTPALKACKEALEQPAQEPVSLGDFDNMTKAECVDYIEYLRKEIDLLRFKEWQELSDDEISKIWWADHYDHIEFARLIEQALKEKNT